MTSTDEVIQFISECGEVIVKPVSGSLGNGIFKVKRSELTQNNVKDILQRIYSTDSIVEECIKGCKALQQFHTKSLNTIRVVTMYDGKQHEVFGAFFRMGRGNSVVDNAHAGGIFAHIDVATGILDSNGINTKGESYENHPDTGIKIKGCYIPQWSRIKESCIKAHKLCPNFIVGWDVVINDNDEIDFIEGNHAPDMDLMQAPLKKGVRCEFERLYNSFRNTMSHRRFI